MRAVLCDTELACRCVCVFYVSMYVLFETSQAVLGAAARIVLLCCTLLCSGQDWN